MAKFTKFDKTSQWVSGTCGRYYFNAKLFDIPSDYGINYGRVSKLCIVNDQDNIVLNYDRGWDIEPELPAIHIALGSILKLCEKAPQRFTS